MPPKYMIFIDGSLFPYDRAICLLADVRARGVAQPVLFKRKTGLAARVWYDVMLVSDLRQLAADEADELEALRV